MHSEAERARATPDEKLLARLDADRLNDFDKNREYRLPRLYNFLPFF